MWYCHNCAPTFAHPICAPFSVFKIFDLFWKIFYKPCAQMSGHNYQRVYVRVQMSLCNYRAQISGRIYRDANVRCTYVSAQKSPTPPINYNNLQQKVWHSMFLLKIRHSFSCTYLFNKHFNAIKFDPNSRENYFLVTCFLIAIVIHVVFSVIVLVYIGVSCYVMIYKQRVFSKDLIAKKENCRRCIRKQPFYSSAKYRHGIWSAQPICSRTFDHRLR